MAIYSGNNILGKEEDPNISRVRVGIEFWRGEVSSMSSCHSGNIQEPGNKWSPGQGYTGSTDLSGVICLVPEYIIGINIVGSWHSHHIESLAYELRAIIVEKANWKTTKLPLPEPINIASRGGW